MLHFFMKKQAREKNKIDIGIKELIYQFLVAVVNTNVKWVIEF